MDKDIRKAVRTFLIKDNNVVATKYKTEKNLDYYDIPGGKIENGETSLEASIREFGYKFIPKVWSTEAYKYVFANPTQLINSYKTTITFTAIATVLSVLVQALYAYPLSRPNFKLKKFSCQIMTQFMNHYKY